MTTEVTGGKAPGALREMLARGQFILRPGCTKC